MPSEVNFGSNKGQGSGLIALLINISPSTFYNAITKVPFVQVSIVFVKLLIIISNLKQEFRRGKTTHDQISLLPTINNVIVLLNRIPEWCLAHM